MMYSLMQSSYNFPNIVLPLIGGVFCDRIGERKTQTISTVVSVVGQTLLVVGFYYNHFPTILLARFIFGISETQDVSLAIFITKWFNNSQLTLANSIFLSVIRLVGIFAAIIVSKYSTIYSLVDIFIFSVLVTIFGLIVSIILVIIDSKYSF